MQSCNAVSRGSLRVPLVPAHEHADAPEPGRKGLEPQIPWREVILLVIKRVVWDVHLPINPDERSVRIQDRRGIVINPRGAPFKERRHDRHVQFFRQLSDGFGGRPGDRFGQIENRRILALAKVLRPEKLLRADYLCPALGRLPDAPDDFVHVRLHIGRAGCLNDADGER